MIRGDQAMTLAKLVKALTNALTHLVKLDYQVGVQDIFRSNGYMA